MTYFKELGEVSGAVPLHLGEATTFKVKLSGNTTFTFANRPETGHGAIVTVLLNVNSHVPTFTGVTWVGTEPAFTGTMELEFVVQGEEGEIAGNAVGAGGLSLEEVNAAIAAAKVEVNASIAAAKAELETNLGISFANTVQIMNTIVPTVSLEEYGGKQETGHDNGAPLQEAAEKLYEEAVNAGKYEGSILLKAGNYPITRAYQQIEINDNKFRWNSQAPLFGNADTAQKFTLTLDGQGAVTADHWDQTAAQVSGGTVFQSTASSGGSGEYGYSSVIGGPTMWAEGEYANFTNVHLKLKGVTIAIPPATPTICLDARCIAQLTGELSCITTQTPAEMDALEQTHENYGLYAPLLGNNAVVQLDNFNSEGLYYPAVITEHFYCSVYRAFYCSRGLLIAQIEEETGEDNFPLEIPDANMYSIVIPKMTVGNVGRHVIQTLGDDGEQASCCVFINMDVEAWEKVSGGAAFSDAEHILRGVINCRNYSSDAITLEGAERVEINVWEGGSTYPANLDRP